MPNGQEIPGNLRAIKEQLANRLFAEFPNYVTGIAIGFHPSQQQPSQQEILIFVERAPDCELEAVRQAAQKTASGGFRLLRTGMFYGLQSTARRSVSFYAQSRFNLPQVSAGTLGAIAEVAGKKFGLCSNHVVAHNGRVPIGSRVVSPGTLDATIHRTKQGARTIAHLSSFAELKPVSWPPPPPSPPGSVPAARPSPPNRVDGALAELTPRGVAKLLNLTPVQPLPVPANQIAVPTAVRKTGRTTGETHSEVCMVDCECYIDLDFGPYYFQELVAVVGHERPASFAFAGKGDSGALVVTDPAGQGVGLVTARAFNPDPGPYHGYIVLVCPLDLVLKELAPTIGTTPDQMKLWLPA